MVNVTIGVDGNISVTDGDSIACDVEQALYQDINLLRRAYIHYHPSQIITDKPILVCEPIGQHQHEPDVG